MRQWYCFREKGAIDEPAHIGELIIVDGEMGVPPVPAGETPAAPPDVTKNCKDCRPEPPSAQRYESQRF
jgi:hypothetical protein